MATTDVLFGAAAGLTASVGSTTGVMGGGVGGGVAGGNVVGGGVIVGGGAGIPVPAVLTVSVADIDDMSAIRPPGHW